MGTAEVAFCASPRQPTPVPMPRPTLNPATLRTAGQAREVMKPPVPPRSADSLKHVVRSTPATCPITATAAAAAAACRESASVEAAATVACGKSLKAAASAAGSATSNSSASTAPAITIEAPLATTPPAGGVCVPEIRPPGDPAANDTATALPQFELRLSRLPTPPPLILLDVPSGVPPVMAELRLSRLPPPPAHLLPAPFASDDVEYEPQTPPVSPHGSITPAVAAALRG